MSKPNEAALDLFRGLLWPAAAGNVLWSLASLAMKPAASSDAIPVVSRIVLLLLLGLYLSLEFLRNYRNLPEPITPKFWFFDSIHLAAVVITALGAYESLPFLHIGLVLYLAGTGIGHAVGAYKTPRDGPRSHLALAFVNFSGLPFVVLSHCHSPSSCWSIPASFGVPLLIWLFVRRRNIAALAPVTTVDAQAGRDSSA